jgi:hypothetical protein
VTLLGRLFRLVWGGDIDPALRPVLAVGLVGSIAGATVYPFMGIWAIKHLHAPQGELAFAYLAGAVLAGLTGYVGGHVGSCRATADDPRRLGPRGARPAAPARCRHARLPPGAS